VDGQLPYEVHPGPAWVSVAVDKAESAPAQVEVQLTAPAILKQDASWAMAVNDDGSMNSPETPALPGSTITVYLTGIGAVDYPVGTGAGAPVEPLSRPLAPSMAMIGDQPAEIAAIYLTPGFVGLVQASLIIPELAPGGHAVVITVGESSSNAAIVAVGAP
jgi:uncharacterized protein (TIGR03437 family)